MKKRYTLLIIVLIIMFGVINVYADNCYNIFGSGLMKVIKDILDALKVIAPILLLILTYSPIMGDFLYLTGQFLSQASGQ